MLGFFIIAIDSEVSEMHKGILDEHRFKTEFLSTQPCKALLIDKGLKGMEVCNKHINPHIKLIAIEQERVDYILLHYYIVSVVQLSEVVYHFYAPPSGFTNGLHYPVIKVAVHYLLLVEFYTELRVLLGKVVSERKEVERNPEHLPKRIQVFIE